ncbi:MAG: heparinase II/III family protein [Alphaproteobacteria bacterium]
MKPAGKIMQKMRRGVETVAYSNLLYRKILAAGNGPDRLHFTLPDPWPGDAAAGQLLLSAQRSMFDNSSAVSLRQAGTVLRNLRAVGTEAARNMAVILIENWLDHHDSWSEAEWAADVLGERIASWIGFYEFYAPAASAQFAEDLTDSLHRQWKHLVRVMPPNLTGVTGLRAIKGLMYGGLNFPESEKALGLAIDLLKRQLSTELLPDGGSISRNPSVQLHMLRHLVDLRAAFKAAELEIPEILNTAIQAMVPVVKFFRHGDGGLGLFHGSAEETSLLIDAVLNQAEVRSRALRRLPDSGYERLTAGRSLLLADCSAPPPRGYDLSGHAGLLSFEFGIGKERLIVNCGAVLNAGSEWRSACAATAAHSTLGVEDRNACEVMSSGRILSSAQVEAQRFEQDGVQSIEMMHDGYRSKYNIIHRRILSLSADGEELRGSDMLEGPANRNFTLRWHLHPSIQASLAQSGQAALLRTASGSGWRLRIEKGELGLDPSIYCGKGAPRRSLQLKVSGLTEGAQTFVNWSLTREKRT